MKREAVQDFLNLPGIVGVALVNGRSRPYFCGVDQTLNFQQKEALAQGIQQVVETTPDDFDVFEFQFSGHQVYIYKLDHGIILLALTNDQLVYSDYIQVVEKLKSGLQDDITNAIATFRLLAGNITLSKQDYWKSQSEASRGLSTHYDSSNHQESKFQAHQTHTQASPPQNVDSGLSKTSSATPFSSNRSDSASLSPVPIPTQLVTLLSESDELNSGSIRDFSCPEGHTDLKELLAALNYFSKQATQYLGITMVANYWKSSRPAIEWLNNFQVDRSAQIIVSGTSPIRLTHSISPEQHEWIQAWVAAFIQRCSKVIRDFPKLVNKMDIDDRQRFLLLLPLA
ncbi:MAG: hypothetical protein ACFE0I_17580 [Elainellaceae cyanobacterium]